MPLIQSKSKKAFSKNVKAEMSSGKPQDQALAIAYSVKRKNSHKKKMANGGPVIQSNEASNDMKTNKIKHPKMVPSSVLSRRLMDEEDNLQESASVNNGPQKQPREVMNEEGAKRVGPDVPALHMKKMANGGTAANPISRPDTGYGAIIVKHDDEKDENNKNKPMMARGGIVNNPSPSPEEEIEEEHHSSIAAAIMAKRDRQMQLDSDSDEDEMVRMANGGIAELNAPEHEDDASLEEGQVDIDDNEREIPNQFYNRNENAALKENYDEDIMDMSQPMDSNEHADSRESNRSDRHDMVSKIRSAMNKRRQSR